MPGPYSESPNIPGTYRVSQNTVDQILAMGMERALQMARTNPDPEFREAVYRIYPNATGGGQFNRPRFTNPATVGAGPAESSVPGSTGGLSTPPIPSSPMGGSAGPPTGMPNNAPPVPPPPPIPTPTIPTPQIPPQLRYLFEGGPEPGAGGAGGVGTPPSPTGPGNYPLDTSVGGPVNPNSPPPLGSSAGGLGGGVRQPGGGIGQAIAGINYPPPSSVEDAVTQPIGGFGTMVPLPGEGGGGSSYPPASPPIGGGMRDNVVSQRLATGTTAETLNPIVMLLRQIFDASPQTMVQNRDFMYTLGELLGLRTPRTGG